MPRALLRTVHWPIQPVEIRRRFAPPFCPRRGCPQHRLTDPRKFAYRRHGAFVRSDGRRVPRYRCSACRGTFSKQSFAVSYYLKRPELLVPSPRASSTERPSARSPARWAAPPRP